MKRVLDIGNCAPDHSAVRRLIEGNFAGVQVVQAHGADDALAAIKLSDSRPFDLILVNRKLDRDYTDGLDVIKQLQADPVAKRVPVIMLTNHAEYQAAAVAAGAEPGFGKNQYEQPETLAILRRFIS